MSDWSKPTLTSNYSDFVAEVKGRDDDLAKQFDGTTSPNVPSGTIKWNSANRRHEKWNGSSWAELVPKASSSYAIKVEDSERLGGQLPSYYTDIVGRLGYTPLPLVGGVVGDAIAIQGGWTDRVNGSPWYGLGRTDSDLFGSGSTQVHLASYYGLRLRTASTTFDIYMGGASLNQPLSIQGHATLHAGNFNSYAPGLTGGGASGTWGINVTGSSSSAPLLSSLGNYVWVASTLPTGYAMGVTSSFVRPDHGWPDYGTVITARTYAGGGGTMQMYVPYGPGNGGTGLKVRFGNYDVNNGDSWTAWKTLLASDNFDGYALPLIGGTMTGRATMPSATIKSTAPQIDFWDTDQGTTRYLHVNANLMGFLNTSGGWDMYANNSGQVWSASYGWLHDYFFNSVGNCIREGFGAGNTGNCSPGESSVVNCYGTGNMMGYQRELIDNGGQVAIRSVRYYYNCNCNCACDCA